MKRRLFAVIAAALLFAPAAEAVAQTDLRVLLIGNSLMRGAKRPLVYMLANVGIEAEIKPQLPGTWTLDDHAQSLKTENRINSGPWDFVFIQGRASGINDAIYPAVRTLNDKILMQALTFGVPTQVAMVMTWRDRGLAPPAYDKLHGVVGGTTGYIPIAFELDVPVAPIGWAIRNGLVAGDIPTDLWKGHKGRHLSKYGHYLAACVLYSVIRKETPIGVYARPTLDPAIILYLQQLADMTVFGDPAEWNLDVGP